MSQQPVKNRFHQFREGRTRILVNPHFQRWLRELGIEKVGEIVDHAQIDPDRGGRQGLRLFCPDGSADHRYVIRHYAHGGLLRRLLGDRFFLGSRPFREMRITEEIRRRNIPTVQVVASLHHHVWGPFHRGELITKEIPQSKDLVSFFTSFGQTPSKEDVALRREIAQRVGRAVRFMHDRGVYHRDLNLKNLLIEPLNHRNPRVYIIDFDRSRILEPLPLKYRMKNLLRLNRSSEKWKAQGVNVPYTDKARFFRAYAEGDSKIVRAMRDRLKKYRLHARLYRKGWLLDRLLNPSTH